MSSHPASLHLDAPQVVRRHVGRQAPRCTATSPHAGAAARRPGRRKPWGDKPPVFSHGYGVDDSGAASDSKGLRYSTPGRFKGLEADVVLLCDVDGNENACSKRNLYVAVSRARHRLYVFVKEGVQLT